MGRTHRPRERENLSAFKGYLQSQGCLVWRRNVGMFPSTYRGRKRVIRCGEAGQSDLWGFLPNAAKSHFELEVKRPGGRPSPEQVAWLRLINTHTSGIAFWADSMDMLAWIYMRVMVGARIEVDRDGQQFFVGGR